MVRKTLLFNLAILLSIALEIYLIANLFIQDKNSLRYTRSAVGFILVPVSLTVAIRSSSKIQPASKVVILTGVWVAWVILAGIAALATYFYWQNSSPVYKGIAL